MEEKIVEPAVMDAQDNTSFMFALAAILLSKLGGKISLDRRELEGLMIRPDTFVIDGQVEGDKITLTYKTRCQVDNKGRITVNTGMVN